MEAWEGSVARSMLHEAMEHQVGGSWGGECGEGVNGFESRFNLQTPPDAHDS